ERRLSGGRGGQSFWFWRPEACRPRTDRDPGEPPGDDAGSADQLLWTLVPTPQRGPGDRRRPAAGPIADGADEGVRLVGGQRPAPGARALGRGERAPRAG